MEKLHETATERRRQTRNRIYRCLYDTPEGCAKQEIADRLGMSLPTVHQNLAELLRAELVQVGGVQQSTGGRRASRLCVAENARFALGIAVSAHHYRLSAANLRLEEIAYRKVPAQPPLLEGTTLAARVEEFLQEFGLNRDKLLGVGIALPGVLNADRTWLLNAPTLGLRDVDLRPLTEALPYPALLSNDAAGGGYAEWFARPDAASIAYLSLEEGVGGAVLLNGAPYTGANGRSGEFGHICVEPGGLPCPCGRRGCLEAYCSSARISGDLGITVEQFFAGLAQGNRAYHTLWTDYLRHLAVGIAAIRMTLDCDIVLGGSPAQHLAPYLPELRQLVAKHDPFAGTQADYLRLCRYPRHAVALGVALPFIRQFVEQL